MRISWFTRNITPTLGTRVSGYGMEDISFSKWSELVMTGLLTDDGERKVLLVSMDLLCMDVEYIQRFRKECGSILGIPPEAVMLTFTHTHGGPQCNSEGGYGDHLDVEYMEFLGKTLREECTKMVQSGQNMESNLFFYLIQADENKNRRVVTADNYAAFLPHRAELRCNAGGFTDQELVSLMFFPARKGMERFPAFIIGNYAAHPLAAHTLGSGARRISADFPGPFRDYVTAESGADCMYVSGAIGNMIPKQDEVGTEAARRMGVHLGESVLRSLIDATRNRDRFMMKSPKVGAVCRKLTVPVRPVCRVKPEDKGKPSSVIPTILMADRYCGKSEIELEIQCLAIGDVCFVGIPGEWCAELGAEVKWHGAFRKQCIAFSATAYQEYMCPGNFLLQGGYEAMRQHFPARYSIDMVKTAVDATYELRDMLYPLADGREEDNNTLFNQFAITPTPMPVHQAFPFTE